MNNTVKEFIRLIGGSENIGKIFPINIWDKQISVDSSIKEVFITFNLWDNSKAPGLEKLLKHGLEGAEFQESIFEEGFFDIRWTEKDEFYGSLLDFFVEEANKRKRKSGIRSVTLEKFKTPYIERSRTIAGSTKQHKKAVEAWDRLATLYNPALECKCTYSDLEQLGLVTKGRIRRSLDPEKWEAIYVIDRNKDFAEWAEIPEVKQVRFVFELENSQEEKEQFEKCRALVQELKEETKWMNQDGQEHLGKFLEFFEACASLKELNQILTNLIARAKKIGAQEREQEERECKEWRRYGQKLEEFKAAEAEEPKEIQQVQEPEQVEEDEDEIIEVKSYSIELGTGKPQEPQEIEISKEEEEELEKIEEEKQQDPISKEEEDEVTQVMKWTSLTAKALEISKRCGKLLTWNLMDEFSKILKNSKNWSERIKALTEVIEELQELEEIEKVLKNFSKWALVKNYLEIYKSLNSHTSKLAHLKHLKAIARELTG